MAITTQERDVIAVVRACSTIAANISAAVLRDCDPELPVRPTPAANNVIRIAITTTISINENARLAH
jgi:hypothetical protein